MFQVLIQRLDSVFKPRLRSWTDNKDHVWKYIQRTTTSHRNKSHHFYFGFSSNQLLLCVIVTENTHTHCWSWLTVCLFLCDWTSLCTHNMISSLKTEINFTYMMYSNNSLNKKCWSCYFVFRLFRKVLACIFVTGSFHAFLMQSICVIHNITCTNIRANCLAWLKRINNDSCIWI